MHNVEESQLQIWLDEEGDMLLIDVLSTEDFAKRHIPGSINIPFKDNPNFVQQVDGH